MSTIPLCGEQSKVTNTRVNHLVHAVDKVIGTLTYTFQQSDVPWSECTTVHWLRKLRETYSQDVVFSAAIALAGPILMQQEITGTKRLKIVDWGIGSGQYWKSLSQLLGQHSFNLIGIEPDCKIVEASQNTGTLPSHLLNIQRSSPPYSECSGADIVMGVSAFHILAFPDLVAVLDDLIRLRLRRGGGFISIQHVAPSTMFLSGMPQDFMSKIENILLKRYSKYRDSDREGFLQILCGSYELAITRILQTVQRTHDPAEGPVLAPILASRSLSHIDSELLTIARTTITPRELTPNRLILNTMLQTKMLLQSIDDLSISTEKKNWYILQINCFLYTFVSDLQEIVMCQLLQQYGLLIESSYYVNSVITSRVPDEHTAIISIEGTPLGINIPHSKEEIRITPVRRIVAKKPQKRRRSR